MHTLAGITCGTAINLAGYSSPISNEGSSGKTNFISSCDGGLDAVFYYSLPAGLTISFEPPSTYSHAYHEIRYDGSCPGSTSGGSGCDYASNTVSFQNFRSSSMDVYYHQTGFSTADDYLNVQWTVSGSSTGGYTPNPF
jgi:hypothetical protein